MVVVATADYMVLDFSAEAREKEKFIMYYLGADCEMAAVKP